LALAALAGHPAALAISELREDEVRVVSAACAWLPWEGVRQILWHTFRVGVLASGRIIRSEEDASLHAQALAALWRGMGGPADGDAPVDAGELCDRLERAGEEDPQHGAALRAMALAVRGVRDEDREAARDSLSALHGGVPGDSRPDVERALKRGAIRVALG